MVPSLDPLESVAKAFRTPFWTRDASLDVAIQEVGSLTPPICRDFLMARVGIEPTTPRFSVVCSTN